MYSIVKRNNWSGISCQLFIQAIHSGTTKINESNFDNAAHVWVFVMDMCCAFTLYGRG